MALADPSPIRKGAAVDRMKNPRCTTEVLRVIKLKSDGAGGRGQAATLVESATSKRTRAA